MMTKIYSVVIGNTEADCLGKLAPPPRGFEYSTTQPTPGAEEGEAVAILRYPIIGATDHPVYLIEKVEVERERVRVKDRPKGAGTLAPVSASIVGGVPVAPPGIPRKAGPADRLYEKYRPREWQDFIGQSKIMKRINLMRSRGAIGGQAYWISGPSGTGKTTLAYLIAREVADFWSIQEIDAKDATPANLKEFESDFRYPSLAGDKCGKAYIVNEAHGLTAASIGQFLVMLERLPAHVVFVFTTTTAGEERFEGGKFDGKPFLSRCIRLPLCENIEDLIEIFAGHLRDIAQIEGLDGSSPTDYLELVRDKEGNLRACLQAIESGELL